MLVAKWFAVAITCLIGALSSFWSGNTLRGEILFVSAASTSRGDARATILDLFGRFDVVALPEIHRCKEVHEFLCALLRDRQLVERGVTNVVVEFGNAKFQDVADRYVAGEPVPDADVRKIWRDTGQFLVWDSPLYEAFFRTVREVNASLPQAQRLRVLLGDPPIGWEIVHTRADYERYADRDLHLAAVVEREVLRRGQKALFIAGGMHLLNERDTQKEVPDKRHSAGDLLHRRHPGKVFTFWHVTTPPLGGEGGDPQAVIVRGSPLEKKSFAPFAPKGILVQKVIGGEKRWVPLDESDWPSVAQMTDGLLYYGPEATTVEPDAAVYQDRAYVKELRRRAAILSEVYGMDFGQELDRVLARSAKR